jgi:hypothetical protein
MATVSLKVGLPLEFPEVLTSPRQAPPSPAGADVLEFDESAFDPVVRASQVRRRRASSTYLVSMLASCVPARLIMLTLGARACGWRQVYCSGELLSAVQLSGLFEDSKEFVDMPMRHDPEVIIKAFRAIPRGRRRDPATLDAFLKKHFHPPGEDLVVHEPLDHNPDPSILRESHTPTYHRHLPGWPAGEAVPRFPPLGHFLGLSSRRSTWVSRVRHQPAPPPPHPGLLDGHAHYQAWASELNALWKQLVRRVHEGAEQHPQRYSILRRRFPVVVPGGRFREVRGDVA